MLTKLKKQMNKLTKKNKRWFTIIFFLFENKNKNETANKFAINISIVIPWFLVLIVIINTIIGKDENQDV